MMKSNLSQTLILLFALCLFSAFVPLQAQTDCAQVTQIPQTECQTLLDIYNNNNGPDWTDNGGWNVSNTPCTNWRRVTCANNQVSILNLDFNQLSGTIPGSIGELTGLVRLDLSANQLSGTLPSTITNLAGLEILLLDRNNLSGSLPDLSSLSNLRELDLSFNQYTGTIPDSLANLSNLERLFLNDNQLTGSIPDSLGSLTRLIIIALSTNQLTGSIPATFTNLTSLTGLFLFSNQLRGPVPVGLTALVNIPDEVNSTFFEQLALHDNKCLTAAESILAEFLDTKDPAWRCSVASLNITPSTLSTTAIAALDPTDLAAFNASDISQIPANALQALSAEQAGNISADTINGLTPDQFDNLSQAVLGSINGTQLGGLSIDVLDSAMPSQVTSFDSNTVQSAGDQTVLRLLTNLNANQITPADVMSLLPPGWSIDMATGALTVPSGTMLSVRAMPPPSGLPSNLKLPKELPNVNSSLGLGGQGGNTILNGMNQALSRLGLTNIALSQNSQGVLMAEGSGEFSGTDLAFSLDIAQAMQASSNTAAAGVSVLGTGQIVLTTPDMQQFPLIPAVQDPTALAELANGINIELGEEGDVLLSTTNQLSALLFSPFIVNIPNPAPGISFNTQRTQGPL
ncbi:MAG: hypothetical protein AAF512_14235, partial [Pseudomonadota bacterium]